MQKPSVHFKFEAEEVGFVLEKKQNNKCTEAAALFVFLFASSIGLFPRVVKHRLFGAALVF